MELHVLKPTYIVSIGTSFITTLRKLLSGKPISRHEMVLSWCVSDTWNLEVSGFHKVRLFCTLVQTPLQKMFLLTDVYVMTFIYVNVNVLIRGSCAGCWTSVFWCPKVTGSGHSTTSVFRSLLNLCCTFTHWSERSQWPPGLKEYNFAFTETKISNYWKADFVIRAILAQALLSSYWN